MSNSFWNFVTQFVPGGLAKAEEVNTNLSGVAAGLDLIQTEIGKSLQVTNAAGVTDIVLNAAARAGKLISFDTNGDLAATTIMGDWKGDHADASGTDYQIRDVVRDSQGDIDLASLYICIETHTSTGNILADTAKWELLLASSTNIAENVTLDNTGLVVVDETNVKDWILSADAALYKARGTGVTSTYVNTATPGGTTFDQAAVNGEISSDEGYASFSYAGATGVTVSDLTASSTYVYIDRNGNLGQQTTIPTRQDKTRFAFTMRIGVNPVTEQIIGFEYYNNPIGHYTNTMRDIYEFLRSSGVPFRKEQLITGRADLGFDVSAGSLLEFGGTGNIFNPNEKPFDAATNVSYNLMSRTALLSSETELKKVWDNAGSITALGSTTFVGHRLYRFSSGNFAMQYGQGNYANLLLAKAGVLTEEYVLNPALKDATFFGWWIVSLEATTTNGTTQTSFREYTMGLQGGSSSSLSGAVLRGNNASDFLDYDVVRTNLGLGTGNSPTFAGAILTGDLTITNSTPAVKFIESDGTAGFNESIIVQNNDSVSLQHRNGSGGYLARLLQLDVKTSGGGGLDLMTVPGPMTVEGSIATTGTVDGRDVSVDGAKLDNNYAGTVPVTTGTGTVSGNSGFTYSWAGNSCTITHNLNFSSPETDACYTPSGLRSDRCAFSLNHATNSFIVSQVQSNGTFSADRFCFQLIVY
jgi:hypothetical protein